MVIDEDTSNNYKVIADTGAKKLLGFLYRELAGSSHVTFRSYLITVKLFNTAPRSKKALGRLPYLFRLLIGLVINDPHKL